MISEAKIEEWVNLYLKHVAEITPEVHVNVEEGYKFRSVETFQRNFNLDTPDMAAMLDRAIENNNLVAGNMFFPRKMLLTFAQAYPEETRQALQVLFEQAKGISERIDEAFGAFEQLTNRLNEQHGSTSQSYIGLRFLSVLLGFRFPNTCNAIKPREWKMFCKFVDEEFGIPQHTSPGRQSVIINSYVDALRAYIRTVPEIRNLRDALTRGLSFRDDEYRWMAQDVIFVTAWVVAKYRSEPEPVAEAAREPESEVDNQEPLLSPIQIKAGGVTFPFEEYLENLIVKNWARIDFCKDLAFFTDEDGTPGQQYATDVGIIDLLATDTKSGDLVVIELKRGNTGSRVIGQILAYIDWVERNLAAKDQKVRGIVIVAGGNKALFAAQRQVSGKVSVRYYRVKLSIFEPGDAEELAPQCMA